jgi:hypothetical protein
MYLEEGVSLGTPLFYTCNSRDALYPTTAFEQRPKKYQNNNFRQKCIMP